jgi:hypothetical protein
LFNPYSFPSLTTYTIADPELTCIGLEQAAAANNAWKTELAFGIPLPEKFYTSPLTRAIKTCEVTFNGILSDDNRRTVVVEVNDLFFLFLLKYTPTWHCRIIVKRIADTPVTSGKQGVTSKIGSRCSI